MKRIYVFSVIFTFMIVTVFSTVAFADTAKTVEIATITSEQVNLITSTAPDINIGASFTLYNNVATNTTAAQDALCIVMIRPTLNTEVTTGEIPTSVDNGKVYFLSGKTFDDNLASGLASAAMLGNLGQRTDGAISEDLVVTGNLANVRTLNVDDAIADRNLTAEGINNTTTPDIAQNTSGMELNDATPGFTSETVDGIVDARKINEENISSATVNGGEIVQATHFLGHDTINIDNETSQFTMRKNNLVNIAAVLENTATTPWAVEAPQINTTSAGGIAMIPVNDEVITAKTPGAGMTLILG